MKTTINQLEILNRSVTMVKKGMNLQDSLSTSSLIELLQIKLMNGCAKFIFKKKNGELRIANGTLLEKVVMNNTNGYGTPRKIYNCQAYYDVEEQAWRSFKYENLIAILD